MSDRNGKKGKAVTQDLKFGVLFYDAEWQELETLNKRNLTAQQAAAIVLCWAGQMEAKAQLEGIDLSLDADAVIAEVVMEGYSYAF